MINKMTKFFGDFALASVIPNFTVGKTHRGALGLKDVVVRKVGRLIFDLINVMT